MKKKALVFICIFAMLVTLLPTGALAGSSYTLVAAVSNGSTVSPSIVMIRKTTRTHL